MMNTMMMNGGMSLMMLGMFLSTTLWLLLLAGLIWALITWLNRQWWKPAVQGELHQKSRPRRRGSRSTMQVVRAMKPPSNGCANGLGASALLGLFPSPAQ